MRRLIPVLLLLLCSRSYAQEHHRLAGYVQMPGNPLVSYYLDITINGTTVSGYSITDYSLGNRLKASIRGRRSPESEMYIEETGSLDGPNSGVQTYCYFTARLKLSVNNGKQRWSGPFESRQADGTPCQPSNGIMTILDNAPALDPPKPVKPPGMRVQMDAPKPVPPPAPRQVTPAPKVAATPKATSPKPVPKADTVKPQLKPATPKTDTVKPLPKPEAPPKPKPVIVTPPQAPPPKPKPAPVDSNNCLRTYEWSSDSLSFDIWDGWTIDGDVVSLSIGGRSLLDHTKLDEQKRHFSVPLARGLNILIISLHEEGFERPNTPNMTLFDGDKQYDLNISGNPGETARICIIRGR